MNRVIDQNNWAEFLKDYGARNEDRPTRLGVFESFNGNANDFWIEDGLPLIGLDAYPNKGEMRIDIHFDKYTHPIDDVARIVYIEGRGSDQGLDICDTKGSTTILRFEDWQTKREKQ